MAYTKSGGLSASASDTNATVQIGIAQMEPKIKGFQSVFSLSILISSIYSSTIWLRLLGRQYHTADLTINPNKFMTAFNVKMQNSSPTLYTPTNWQIGQIIKPLLREYSYQRKRLIPFWSPSLYQVWKGSMVVSPWKNDDKKKNTVMKGATRMLPQCSRTVWKPLSFARSRISVYSTGTRKSLKFSF